MSVEGPVSTIDLSLNNDFNPILQWQVSVWKLLVILQKICLSFDSFFELSRAEKLVKILFYPRRSILYSFFTAEGYLRKELKWWNFPWNIMTTISNICCQKIDRTSFPCIDIASSENFLTTLCKCMCACRIFFYATIT